MTEKTNPGCIRFNV